MVGLQARGSREFNRVRDLVGEGYVGKVLSPADTRLATNHRRRRIKRHDLRLEVVEARSSLCTHPGVYLVCAWCDGCVFFAVFGAFIAAAVTIIAASLSRTTSLAVSAVR